MKKITVKVIARSSQKKIICDNDVLKIYVHEGAVDGKANKAVRSLLADYFHVSKSNIKIIQGKTSRNKIVAVEI